MMKFLFLLLGFFLLVKGADLFVEGSSGIARLLRIPSIIIGLTVVAFGTDDIAQRQIIFSGESGGYAHGSLRHTGSNIFNLLIVVGVSAAIRPMKIQDSVLKKDFPFSILIAGLLLVMTVPTAYGNGKMSVLSSLEGCILLIIFVAYLAVTVRDALKARQENTTEQSEEPHITSIPTIILYVMVGIAGIVWGGDLVVDSASAIALTFGWSETFIGLTIVALGTSLPELVTSVVAAKKGESDLSLGNAIGSNIFNILLVLGASSAVHPIAVNPFTIYDTIFLIASSIIVYLFARMNELVAVGLAALGKI